MKTTVVPKLIHCMTWSIYSILQSFSLFPQCLWSLDFATRSSYSVNNISMSLDNHQCCDMTLHSFRFQTGSSSTPIWLDDLSCSSFNTRLDDCSHNSIGSNNCDHIEDVYVSCEGSKCGLLACINRMYRWLFHCDRQLVLWGLALLTVPPLVVWRSTSTESGGQFATIYFFKLKPMLLVNSLATALLHHMELQYL